MTAKIKLRELIDGRGDDPYTPIGMARTMAAADILIEIAKAALVAIELNPHSQVFREAMRALRAACSKVEP